MQFHEEIALLIARERMEDAVRLAEQTRAIRQSQARRRLLRDRLGSAVVRFGQWIMGQSMPARRTPIEFHQGQF